ncbi:LuxR C-terminal-related transcriptional regulator [Mycobacterium sp. pUA109]|uniref:helix-turn-helix transcriptional regulator n=1 Tax=Mycobacterium sp. pUA109 TaxID=3238982 RepID=UPI00351B9EF2
MYAESRRASGWPIVARDDELRRALRAVDGDQRRRGVVLVGESGVGKSTLARALAQTLKSDRYSVRFVLGTEAGRAVPLGAFSRSVSVDAPAAPATMLAAAHKTLEQEQNLVLVVDDAQLLDPLSASLVYQLAAGGAARLITTIRSGEAVADAVTALWKEQLLHRMEINAFSRAQTEELARAVLGGAVTSQLVDELYRRTAGNVLLLRGLLSAGRDSGVLVHTETGWQLRGPLHGDDELYDLLEFRLRSLDPEELEAVEILATGELVDWEVLRGLCDADAVARLERRGLIQLVADGAGTVAQLNHPVMGEAAIRLAGAVRSRQLNTVLAEAFLKYLRAGGQRLRLPDVRGRIQLAQFMMRSDMPPDLDVITDAAHSAMTVSNFAFAVELSRFAFERGGGLPVALVLGEALSWLGRGDEAEAVLGGVEPDAGDELLTARWGCVRAMNLFFDCGRVDDARAVITNVKRRVDAAALVGLVSALELSFACLSGDVVTTAEAGLALCSADLPLATMWAAMPTCWALALTGRFGELDRVTDAWRRAAAHVEPGVEQFIIGLGEAVAATAAGDYPEAERVWERYAAKVAGAPEVGGIVTAMLGLVQRARGALASACAALHESMSVLSQGFPWGWLMLVSAWCAQAEGMRGDGEAAAAALHSSERSYGPQFTVFLPELELARAWERAAVGQTAAARTHAVSAAQLAHRSGMAAVELHALHTAVRLGDRSCAARVAELAAVLGTPLAAAMAGQARGLAGHDGDLLDAAADRFVELGALALAADAAAQAAAEHGRGGHRGKEIGSSTRADRLAGRCGLRTPATVAAARPLPITGREREIATLVASGWSNRQIADRLIVSVRTIDGHLYRIFAKLGINNRDQLIELLTPDRPQD